MEDQRVISIIEKGLAWARWTDEQKEALIIAGEAVKKQIPQRVIRLRGVSNQACPICKSNANGNYCSFCGQKLIRLV